jgi:hypothetical protein
MTQKNFKILIKQEMIVKIISFFSDRKLMAKNYIQLMINYNILLLSNPLIMNNLKVILHKNLGIFNKITMLINIYTIH